MSTDFGETKIIQNAYYQAKKLLEEFGEFYPFAIGTNEKLEIFNINTYFGNEYPNVLEYLEELKKVIPISIKDNKLFAVCLCVNVRIKPPYFDQKLDAIEIQINNSICNSINYYIPYEFNGQTIDFFELFEMPGTLKIWQ